MKKAILCIAICCFAAAYIHAASMVHADVTDGYLDYKDNYAGLKWAVKLGDGWQSSPTPPAVHGDYIYCAKTTKIVKINKHTGKTVKTADISKGQKFTIIPVKYIEAAPDNGFTEDVIAVPLYNGKIQIFEADDLESRYITQGCAEAKNGIQLTTNIAYDNGYIYFGTWYGDEYDGCYYCYKAGEKTPLWTVKKKGGFYLSDADFVKGRVCFGSDNGLRSAAGGKSTLFVCKKGEDYIAGEDPVVYKDTVSMEGNCRAAVVSDGSSIFTVTQAGKAYKFDMSGDRTLTKVCEKDLGAPSTGRATIYKGVIYYCLGDSTIVSLRTDDLSQINKTATPGYVQGGVAVSTAKEDEEGLFIYGSYNKEPAGLFAVNVAVTGEFKSSKILFTPPSSMKQYNMTPIILDGSEIYYRNDSGNIMALESGYTLWTQAGSGGKTSAGLSAKEGSTYTFKVTANKGYKCADIIVDGVSSAGAASYTFRNVKSPHELKAVFIQKSAPVISSVAQSRYDKLTVKWKKAAGVTAYELFKGTSANGRFSKITTTKTCSYTDTGIIAGVKCFYKVKGIYKRGGVRSETGTSAPKSGMTALSKTKVKAAAKKGKKALIKWRKTEGATGYEIWRCTKKKGKYKKVATIKKGTVLKWINKRLKKGKKYGYKVRAIRKTVKGTALSAFSNTSYIKSK